MFFRCFYDFLGFSGDLRESLEVFGNIQEFLQNFGSKVFFSVSYDFLKFS